jgi:predicted dithiol-disulfide oxidoreductase (DUF899 family)
MNADFLMSDEVTRAAKDVLAAKARLRDAMTRATPESVEDCDLRRPDGSSVRLSALFAGKPDLILWHNMGRSCVYCTLWADSLRGYAEHLGDRAALALTSADEPAVLKEFSEARRWNFPCVSAAGTAFLKALKMQGDDGPWPGISALHKEPSGRIVRTGYTYFGPGDDFCPVWPALDLLPGGAAGWAPKYSYGPHVTSIGVERHG